MLSFPRMSYENAYQTPGQWIAFGLLAPMLWVATIFERL